MEPTFFVRAVSSPIRCLSGGVVLAPWSTFAADLRSAHRGSTTHSDEGVTRCRDRCCRAAASRRLRTAGDLIVVISVVASSPGPVPEQPPAYQGHASSGTPTSPPQQTPREGSGSASSGSAFQPGGSRPKNRARANRAATLIGPLALFGMLATAIALIVASQIGASADAEPAASPVEDWYTSADPA